MADHSDLSPLDYGADPVCRLCDGTGRVWSERKCSHCGYLDDYPQHCIYCDDSRVQTQDAPCTECDDDIAEQIAAAADDAERDLELLRRESMR